MFFKEGDVLGLLLDFKSFQVSSYSLPLTSKVLSGLKFLPFALHFPGEVNRTL